IPGSDHNFTNTVPHLMSKVQRRMKLIISVEVLPTRAVSLTKLRLDLIFHPVESCTVRYRHDVSLGYGPVELTYPELRQFLTVLSVFFDPLGDYVHDFLVDILRFT